MAEREGKGREMRISRTFPSRIRSYSKIVVLLCAVVMVGTNVLGDELNSGNESMQIRPCPRSPNCVSSLDPDPGHGVEPLHYDSVDSQALHRLRIIIEEMPRTRIVQFTERYLHAEFKSAIFGFVDDLELLVGEVPGVIHIRSSSRVGYWDLGVNRRRVERIREKFVQIQPLSE